MHSPGQRKASRTRACPQRLRRCVATPASLSGERRHLLPQPRPPHGPKGPPRLAYGSTGSGGTLRRARFREGKIRERSHEASTEASERARDHVRPGCPVRSMTMLPRRRHVQAPFGRGSWAPRSTRGGRSGGSSPPANNDAAGDAASWAAAKSSVRLGGTVRNT